MEENKAGSTQRNDVGDRVLQDIMVDLSPCFAVILSAELEPIDCNETAVKYLEYTSKEDLTEHVMADFAESIPPFQPDASPTIPIPARIEYVVEHGSHDFEMEIVLNRIRVPLRFMLRKVDLADTYVIACFMLDTQALKEARNDLLRHDFLMRQVNRAATRLLSANPENFDVDIIKTLTSLAQGVGACQMAILENNKQDEKAGCFLLYRWSIDRTAYLLNSDQNGYAIDYSDVPDWYETLSANRRVNDSGAKLIAQGRSKYFPRGTKAFMMIPVFLQKKFWGIIAVSKTGDDQPFSNAEERATQSGGILIVTAILRNQINKNLIVAREAAMASERAKSLFLSRMSHEIRTPLNAILGMTAVAQKSEDHNQIKYSLRKIEMASGQLLNLVNDILDMSKIEAGKLEMVLEPFDFMQMLEKVIDIQRISMEEKQHSFRLECSKPFDRFMITDELRLSQVLINLLGNAVKFTPNGGSIILRIDYDDISDSGDCKLAVEVEDDGIGISDDQQQRLFHSFEQADGSIPRRFGGSGLGLAICKNIVQLLGGDIRMNSVEGQGACFAFDICFNMGEPLSGTEPFEADYQKPTFIWTGKHILLAEDIEVNREIVVAMLDETGVQVTCAEDGCEAVQLFQETPEKFSVILMDVQMPRMDGLEATKQIRSLERGLHLGQDHWPDNRTNHKAAEHAEAKRHQPGGVPILAMTANAFSSDVARCLDAGMTEHIAKPIDFTILLERLSKYLGN